MHSTYTDVAPGSFVYVPLAVKTSLSTPPLRTKVSAVVPTVGAASFVKSQMESACFVPSLIVMSVPGAISAEVSKDVMRVRT